MKKLLCILLTLSLTLMLASAALADDPITLRFSSWGDAAEKAILEKALARFTEETGINVEYVYAFTGGSQGSAYVVLRVDDNEHAESVLGVNGIRTLNDEDLYSVLA